MRRLLPLLLLLGSTPLVANNSCPTPAGFEAVDNTVVYNTGQTGKKRVVLTNLWALWCPPCLKELPLLNQLAASAVFTVEAIHVGGSAEAVKARLNKLQAVHLQPVLEPDMGIINRLGFQGLPATLVSIGGKVHYRHHGDIKHDRQTLENWLNCLDRHP